jgi:uncharacterized protein with FMN-binding domain
MKRVLAALFGTITGLVILLDFKTHPVSVASPPAATTTTGNATGSSGSSGTSGSGSSSSGSSASSGSSKSSSTTTPKKKASSSSASSTKTGTKTYTGAAIDTQYGPVQVQITVTNGKVTKADAVVYPSQDPRDQEINSYAIPALDQEAVSAGSAQINMVSGATYTSAGYIQSLQSALDKAGL